MTPSRPGKSARMSAMFMDWLRQDPEFLKWRGDVPRRHRAGGQRGDVTRVQIEGGPPGDLDPNRALENVDGFALRHRPGCGSLDAGEAGQAGPDTVHPHQ